MFRTPPRTNTTYRKREIKSRLLNNLDVIEHILRVSNALSLTVKDIQRELAARGRYPALAQIYGILARLRANSVVEIDMTRAAPTDEVKQAIDKIIADPGGDHDAQDNPPIYFKLVQHTAVSPPQPDPRAKALADLEQEKLAHRETQGKLTQALKATERINVRYNDDGTIDLTVRDVRFHNCYPVGFHNDDTQPFSPKEAPVPVTFPADSRA